MGEPPQGDRHVPLQDKGGLAMHEYDLVVIGSGPASQRAAIAAAKLGKRVAVAERNTEVGGGSILRGTIPSKTLREAVSDLSGAASGRSMGWVTASRSGSPSKT